MKHRAGARHYLRGRGRTCARTTIEPRHYPLAPRSSALVEYQRMDITQFESMIPVAYFSGQQLVAHMPPAHVLELETALRNAGGAIATGPIVSVPDRWPWNNAVYRGTYRGVHIFSAPDATETTIVAVSPSQFKTAAKVAGAEQVALSEQVQRASAATKAVSDALAKLRIAADATRAGVAAATQVALASAKAAVAAAAHPAEKASTGAPSMSALRARARQLLADAMGLLETADSDDGLTFAERFTDTAVILARAVGVGKTIVITAPHGLASATFDEVDGPLIFDSSPSEVSVGVLDMSGAA